ncbi:NIPSNAP family protein [uncultured Hymenobacter sp.]|uniref:NIPSNAP family protein n=1 Tax=uncultured Hymenobacter sp. TaxID=170016 RepID=UPI0035CBE4D1
MKQLLAYERPNKVGLLFLVAMALLLLQAGLATAADREIYQLKIYHLKDKQQEERVDAFLKDAFVPALHKLGVQKIGVFKPIGNDTAVDRRILVLIPYKSFNQLLSVTERLDQDKSFESNSQYWTAAYNNPPYTRLETIQIQSMSDKIQLQEPQLKGPRPERVYELRSYESPNEKIHANKVQMFVQGGEIDLFKRLGFNGVFYGRVLAGSHMPNLMYLTTFENKAARDEHWKTFGADPEWKKLSALPEYQHNVSRNQQTFLYPVAYSDF